MDGGGHLRLLLGLAEDRTGQDRFRTGQRQLVEDWLEAYKDWLEAYKRMRIEAYCYCEAFLIRTIMRTILIATESHSQ